MQYLSYAGYSLLACWAFWALYVFTMGIYRAKLRKKLAGLNLVFAFPIVLVAVIVDVFFNIFIASALFLELPKELLVTKRLQRYMKTHEHTSWRRKIAEYICDSVLDVFDPEDDHC